MAGLWFSDDSERREVQAVIETVLDELLPGRHRGDDEDENEEEEDEDEVKEEDEGSSAGELLGKRTDKNDARQQSRFSDRVDRESRPDTKKEPEIVRPAQMKPRTETSDVKADVDYQSESVKNNKHESSSIMMTSTTAVSAKWSHSQNTPVCVIGNRHL